MGGAATASISAQPNPSRGSLIVSVLQAGQTRYTAHVTDLSRPCVGGDSFRRSLRTPESLSPCSTASRTPPPARWPASAPAARRAGGEAPAQDGHRAEALQGIHEEHQQGARGLVGDVLAPGGAHGADADLARHMAHIAKSNASTPHSRSKMNQSLLRKLRLAARHKKFRCHARAA